MTAVSPCWAWIVSRKTRISKKTRNARSGLRNSSECTVCFGTLENVWVARQMSRHFDKYSAQFPRMNSRKFSLENIPEQKPTNPNTSSLHGLSSAGNSRDLGTTSCVATNVRCWTLLGQFYIFFYLPLPNSRVTKTLFLWSSPISNLKQPQYPSSLSYSFVSKLKRLVRHVSRAKNLWTGFFQGRSLALMKYVASPRDPERSLEHTIYKIQPRQCL